MRVLVGCECSGVVRDAFLALGHDAWSCDLKPSETPGPHLQCDVFEVLDDNWDLGIFHPECKYLTCSAEWAYGDGPYHQKLKPGTLVGAERRVARTKAVRFAKRLWECDIPRIAVENPVGILSSELGRPQIIQPYQFGEDASKATCLWLKNLPPLVPTTYFPPRIVVKDGKEYKRWSNQTDSGQNRLSPSENRSADRARTYPGIAKAMATQWGTATQIGSREQRCSHVFDPCWPEELKTRTFYRVPCDDKGANGGTWLELFIDDQGDVFVSMQDWEEIPEGSPSPFPSLRMRTLAGGGRNCRVRQALLWLAEAIRLDNLDHQGKL